MMLFRKRVKKKMTPTMLGTGNANGIHDVTVIMEEGFQMS